MKTKLEELRDRANRFYQKHAVAITWIEIAGMLGISGLGIWWIKKDIHNAIWKDRVHQIGLVILAMRHHLDEVGISESQFQELIDKSIRPV